MIFGKGVAFLGLSPSRLPHLPVWPKTSNVSRLLFRWLARRAYIDLLGSLRSDNFRNAHFRL